MNPTLKSLHNRVNRERRVYIGLFGYKDLQKLTRNNIEEILKEYDLQIRHNLNNNYVITRINPGITFPNLLEVENEKR